ncbi:hypothetical protein Pelo_7190 [Pelomyxa schiedti]|nr:hypothetical protein Pelo_7190 [Pelomyxa schiedti]
MKLTPMLTVVGGHPTPLAKLKTIMPEQAKLLPIHDAFHSPFYQEDGMTQFIKEKIALGRHEVWAPVPDSPAFISSFRQADISMIEAAEFFEQMQRDGIQNSINWPACTKAAVTVNGGCKAVELYDLGPTGIAFLTHNLCAQMFALKSTLINCVNTHDPDKKRAAVTTSEPTPTPTTEGVHLGFITALCPATLQAYPE